MSTPAQVWQYRTLISNLAQRDLKSRYKKSFLGWLWSLINPAVTLGIYTIVFGIFLGAVAPVAGNGEMQVFALYLFAALVAWNFSGTINNAIASFASAGGDPLTRTYFPPECPMFAGLATVALQAGLETLILVAFMVVFGNVSWTFLVGLPILFLLGCPRRPRADPRPRQHPLPRASATWWASAFRCGSTQRRSCTPSTWCRPPPRRS